MPASSDPPDGVGLAVIAEALYLANLLLLPGMSFLGLLALWWRGREHASPLARAHLAQTVSASLWGGLLLVLVNAMIVALGGYRGPHVWVLIIIYFTLVHSTLVVFGAYGLAKAMAGQCWRFPLVGRPLPGGCAQPSAS
jgi:uncharacterized Tic20 family protein